MGEGGPTCTYNMSKSWDIMYNIVATVKVKRKDSKSSQYTNTQKL